MSSSLLAGLRKWQTKTRKSWKIESLRITFRNTVQLEAVASIFEDAGLVVAGDQFQSWGAALVQHARCQKHGILATIARDSIGRLTGAAVGTGSNILEVEEVAVLEHSRLQGVGTELLRSLESLAKVGGAHTCHAFVPEDDLESQLFFRGAGYAVPRNRTGILEVDGSTSYRFVRSLGEPDDFSELDDGD